MKKKETDKLFLKLKRKVRKVAARLGFEYNLRKIYLFGSLTDRNSFHLESDIDIAIDGLKSRDYLNLWGDFEKCLQHRFDLVNMNNVGKRFIEYILEEGEIIYDSQETQGQ